MTAQAAAKLREMASAAGVHRMTDYYCNACGKTTKRDSTKRWIRSYCESTGRMSRLWRKERAS